MPFVKPDRHPGNRIRTRLQSFLDCATIQAGLRVHKALPLRGAFSFPLPRPKSSPSDFGSRRKTRGDLSARSDSRAFT